MPGRADGQSIGQRFATQTRDRRDVSGSHLLGPKFTLYRAPGRYGTPYTLGDAWTVSCVSTYRPAEFLALVLTLKAVVLLVLDCVATDPMSAHRTSLYDREPRSIYVIARERCHRLVFCSPFSPLGADASDVHKARPPWIAVAPSSCDPVLSLSLSSASSSSLGPRCPRQSFLRTRRLVPC